MASRENPNVCIGCAQLLDDISPQEAAAHLTGQVRAPTAQPANDASISLFLDLIAYDPTAVAAHVADGTEMCEGSSHPLGHRK